MDLHEMILILEAVARDPDTPPSARVRSVEVLARLSKSHPPEEVEWSALVRQFAPDDAE